VRPLASFLLTEMFTTASFNALCTSRKFRDKSSAVLMSCVGVGVGFAVAAGDSADATLWFTANDPKYDPPAIATAATIGHTNFLGDVMGKFLRVCLKSLHLHGGPSIHVNPYDD